MFPYSGDGDGRVCGEMLRRIQSLRALKCAAVQVEIEAQRVRLVVG